MKFVSLLGGLTRRFAANPFDVIHRLAENTGAEAYLMPVPFFANSIEDKKVLLAQHGMREVLAAGATRASLLIVGIGEIERRTFPALGGMVARRRDRGGAQALARPAKCSDSSSTLDGRPFEQRSYRPGARARHRRACRGAGSWRSRGGRAKVAAIRAILASGCSRPDHRRDDRPAARSR